MYRCNGCLILCAYGRYNYVIAVWHTLAVWSNQPTITRDCYVPMRKEMPHWQKP